MLPYQRSSWTVYVQQWDWLKGFLLLGTNYDRAWLYDLSLRHPPTLWARSEGSSVSIVHLYCTLTLIHTTAQFLKINLHCFDLVEEGSRGLWACSLIHQCQSWLKHRYTVTGRITSIQRLDKYQILIRYCNANISSVGQYNNVSLISQNSCHKSYSAYHAVHEGLLL